MALLQVAMCTEMGARPYNEDRVLHGSGGNGLFAVLADGAGGHSRGAEAAERATRCIERQLLDEPVAFSPAKLSTMVRAAHRELQQHQDPGGPGGEMHCTLVVLWVDPAQRHVLWTHVGDSRLYRVRHGRIDVITVDDSVVQRMVQAGLLTVEQARTHPHRNQLLAALGIEGEIEPHTVVRPVELLEGDAFLLASDGWWDCIEPRELTGMLNRALQPAQWLAMMRDRIVQLDKAQQDNFSAVAVWVGDPAEVTVPRDDDTRPGGWRRPG